MKKLIFPLFILVGLLVADGCKNNSTDPKEMAEETNDAKFANKTSERDAQFVVDAYSSGLEEVRMSQDAKTYGYTTEVKDFAGKMVAAHTTVNEKLERLAADKQITIPHDLSRKQYDDLASLNSKKGKDYDKAFMDKQVSAHKDAIDLFEKASKEAQDADIRALFASSLAELRMHLEMATTARDNLKQ